MQTDNAVGVGVECGVCVCVCVCACACVVKVCNNTHTQADCITQPPDGPPTLAQTAIAEAKAALAQKVFIAICDWHAPASRLVLVLVLVC